MRYILFWVVSIIFLGSMVALVLELPTRVASHFNLLGQANSWSSKEHFIGMMALLEIGAPALICFVLPSLPLSLMNIPNKSYWMAPEHRGYVKEVLKDGLTEVAALLLALFAGLNFAVIQANQQSPPALASWLLIGIIAVFLPVTIVQTWSLMRRFRVPSV